MMQPRTEKPTMSFAESANTLVIKLRMQCKQPELADEVKDLFERMLYSLKAYSVEDVSLKHKIDEAKTSFDDVPDLKDMLGSLSNLKNIDEATYETVVNLLSTAASFPDTAIDCKKDVDYSCCKPSKGTWPLVQRDHGVLLALSRAYRFMVDASDTELSEYGHSRTSLARKIRALEISAAVRGIEI